MKEKVERKVYHICVQGTIICGQRKTVHAAPPPSFPADRVGIHRECKKCRRIWDEHGTFPSARLGLSVGILVT